jgi:chain length determinant protein EpsF
MTLRQFLLILSARRRVALGILGAFVALALAAAFLLPNKYTASASVVVDFKPEPDASSGFAAQLSTASYIATQVDIIGSQRVAGRAVRTLKLDKVPRYVDDWRSSTGGRGDIVDWIAGNLQKAITVTPSRESNVIDIAATTTDPKFSADLANAFAQSYIDTLIELKVDAAKHYSTWFDERSRELRADVEAKQKRLADYERTTGIVPSASDGHLDVESARLAELNTQLITIQSLRQDSQSRARGLGGDNESLPEVLQNPVISSLKADLSKAQAKLQDIETNSGKNYPDYKTTAAEVADLKDRIARESARVAESINNTNQVNLRRENEVLAEIAAQKKRMQELTHQNDEVTVLQNDVLAAQKSLDLVSQRLAQTNLESATQQTNISLLTPAIEPLKRSSPKRLLIFVIGLFLGTLAALATALTQELLDRRVRDDEELAELLGVPLLGKIGRVKFSERGDSEAAPGLARLESSPI